MIPFLNIRSSLVREVSIVDRRFAVQDAPSPMMVFMSQLTEPDVIGRGGDRSPRDEQSLKFRVRPQPLGPDHTRLVAGNRVSMTTKGRLGKLDTQVYEILDDPVPIYDFGFEEGYETQVQRVTFLYPYVVDVKAQNGTLIAGAESVALWSTREGHEDRGTYEDFDGEAAVHLEGIIQQNASLWAGTDRYRITSVITDLKGPRLRFTARRSNG